MLARREIRKDVCYVNEDSRELREVLMITREQKVIFNGFDMDTGNLLRTPNRTCHKNQLIRWADREASPEECSKLNRIEAETLFANDRSDTPSDLTSHELSIAQAFTTSRNQSPVGYWCRVR